MTATVEPVTVEPRRCNKCGGLFAPRPWQITHRNWRCLPCKQQNAKPSSDKWKRSRIKAAKKWNAANPEKMRQHRLAWKNANIERTREYQKKRRATDAGRHMQCIWAKKWRFANPGKVTAGGKARAAAKIQAIPMWANKKKIQELYVLANMLGLTVDHIIPLQSKVVCGLHCEENMQLLSLSENSRKGNKFTEPTSIPLFVGR